MKKLIYLFGILSFLAFMGCSEDSEPKPSTNPDLEPEPEEISIVVEPFSVSVEENIAQSAVIGTLRVTSNASNLSYSMRDQIPNGSLIIGQDGSISVQNNAVFDYEINKQITATVLVEAGDVQAQGTISIAITNQVEIFAEPFEITIDEHPATGTILGSIQAINESGGTLAFNQSGESHKGAFGLIINTGEVIVLNSELFEYSVNPVLTAQVIAFNETDVASTTITINLKEVVDLQPLDVSTMNYVEMTGSANLMDGFDVGSDAYPSTVDLDRDGDLDIVVGSLDGTFAYFQNNRNQFTQINGTENPFNGIGVGNDSRHTFEDVDLDGDYDLVSGTGAGGIHYFANNAGVFIEKTGAESPFNGISMSLDSKPTFGDVNGDGLNDLVLAGFNGNYKYYTRSGDAYSLSSSSPFSGIIANTHAYPVLVDIDNDGDLDLVAGKYNGQFEFYQNDGGVYSLKTDAEDPFDQVSVGVYSAPAFMDIDSDGDLDMFSGNSDGTLKYFDLRPK